jgi:hypothetical protein
MTIDYMNVNESMLHCLILLHNTLLFIDMFMLLYYEMINTNIVTTTNQVCAVNYEYTFFCTHGGGRKSHQHVCTYNHKISVKVRVRYVSIRLVHSDSFFSTLLL